MEYRSAKGFSGWGQFGILFAFIGAGFIIAAIIQFSIGFKLIDANLSTAQWPDAMLKALIDPKNTAWLQISQIASTFFLLFLPAVIYSWICNGKSFLWLGFSQRINLWQILLGFCIIFCAGLIAQPAEELSKQVIAHFPGFNKWAKGLEDTYSQTVMAISNLKTWGSLIVAIITIAFFPAMFEEVFFRGAMQNLFVKWWKKPLLAIVVTSLIFSFIHGEAYPFLSRAILGFALGLLYYQSKNIWVNIIAHLINNSIALAQMFIIARSNEKPDVSKIDQQFPVWMGLVSIGVIYFIFVLFKRVSAKNKAAIEMDELKLFIKSTPQYNLAETETHNPIN